MSLDPEKAWRPPGKERYVLQRSDNVFIALHRPVDCTEIVVASARDFGLIPFFYVGLEGVAPSEAVNLHREALGDLYQSQLVVSVLSSDTDIEDDWIFQEISVRHSWGVAVLAYELRIDGKKDHISDHRRLFPEDVNFQIVEPAALEDVLRNDLSILSSK